MIDLILPPPISANRYWRSRVVRKGGRSFPSVYVSAEADAYREHVAWIARAAGVREPIQGRVVFQYVLVPKRPQDWKKRQAADPDNWADSVQCIDLDNAQKVLLDALKGLAFGDDKFVHRIIADRAEPEDSPHVKVRVSRWTP